MHLDASHKTLNLQPKIKHNLSMKIIGIINSTYSLQRSKKEHQIGSRKHSKTN